MRAGRGRMLGFGAAFMRGLGLVNLSFWFPIGDGYFKGERNMFLSHHRNTAVVFSFLNIISVLGRSCCELFCPLCPVRPNARARPPHSSQLLLF